MKLRIQDNSLRLRVTQKEVAQLCESGRVEARINLSAERPLFYMLESTVQAGTVSADFSGGGIHVRVPNRIVTAWAQSEQVSIEGRSSAGVQLLIEKDFQCLHRRTKHDPDTYPHPAIS